MYCNRLHDAVFCCVMKPYRYISFLIPSALEAALRKAAREHERSMAWIIKKALTEHLVKLGALPKARRR
ncbi:MAG: hypothetical protein ABII00_01265 [Elusimicrobiota bacterium]